MGKQVLVNSFVKHTGKSGAEWHGRSFTSVLRWLGYTYANLTARQAHHLMVQAAKRGEFTGEVPSWEAVSTFNCQLKDGRRTRQAHGEKGKETLWEGKSRTVNGVTITLTYTHGRVPGLTYVIPASISYDGDTGETYAEPSIDADGKTVVCVEPALTNDAMDTLAKQVKDCPTDTALGGGRKGRSSNTGTPIVFVGSGRRAKELQGKMKDKNAADVARSQAKK